ncbi:hypothetical protein, partial [Desulfovibrio piger]|uniref:hypothetical protein n=1 Tax=Desulfovibrio piger TaxID=901 RepID=UPI00242AAAA6
RLVEEFSELAHSLLLLPRQFYGTTLPCFGLYPLEKTGIAICMPDILSAHQKSLTRCADEDSLSLMQSQDKGAKGYIFS